MSRDMWFNRKEEQKTVSKLNNDNTLNCFHEWTRAESPLRVLLVFGALSSFVDRLTVDQNLGRLVLLASVARCKRRLLSTCGTSSLVLLILFFFLFLILVITSFVLLHTVEKIVGQNPKDQEEPEQVHSLQTGEQREGDVLTDPALVLLRFPVEFKGSNCPEFCQDSPENFQVEEMPAVDPNPDKGSEVRCGNDRVEVVESFGCL